MTNDTPSVERHKVALDGGSVAYRRAGEGDPVVLLHGCPQTSHAWRHVIPILSRSHTVIAPDLPGLGDSGPSRTGYTKRAIAATMHELVDHLGLGPVRLVGHDMGACVAYAYAADRPEMVSHLAILDVMLAGAGFEEFGLDFGRGGGLWHFPFQMTPDVPEMLVTGRERKYFGHFWWGSSHDPGSIGPLDADEYLRCYRAPGALSRLFAYYRAWLKDVEDNRELMAKKLGMPVIGIGGAGSMGPYVASSLERVTDHVQVEVLDHCGHWLPEERPSELCEILSRFFFASRST